MHFALTVVDTLNNPSASVPPVLLSIKSCNDFACFHRLNYVEKTNSLQLHLRQKTYVTELGEYRKKNVR